MTRSDQELHNICRQLLEHKINTKALRVTLDEFEKLYRAMEHMTGRTPKLSLVRSLGSELFAQFSEIAPQHFVIINAQAITPETFRFVSNISWHGPPKASKGFLAFLLSELRLNLLKICFVFVISTVCLFVANDLGLYDLISTFLIQSGTVFLSIYLIFTVSQSHKITDDQNLFEHGVTHKYYSDDKNITLLAILTIACTFVNAAIVTIFNANQLPLHLDGLVLDSRLWKAISTSVVVTLLFDSFFTVADYYIGRTLDITERDMISDILDKDFRDTPKMQEK